MSEEFEAPLVKMDRLGDKLGIDLVVLRDDLLPFPLPGNKVRKLRAELAQGAVDDQLIITNGGVDSNHCRTLALLAAESGVGCHLVLHGTGGDEETPGVKLLRELGASVTIVAAKEIGFTIRALEAQAESTGRRVRVIPGGCHSPAGARAYAEVGRSVFEKARPDFVFVASGTGATQGGLAAAAREGACSPRVVGISVARSAGRGRAPVLEAAGWAGSAVARIEFDDRFRAGGYGLSDGATREAVALGWKHGLPLDETYTGKAFAGLVAYSNEGLLDRKRVLFWHTGGLWNHLAGLK